MNTTTSILNADVVVVVYIDVTIDANVNVDVVFDVTVDLSLGRCVGVEIDVNCVTQADTL